MSTVFNSNLKIGKLLDKTRFARHSGISIPFTCYGEFPDAIIFPEIDQFSEFTTLCYSTVMMQICVRRFESLKKPKKNKKSVWGGVDLDPPTPFRGVTPSNPQKLTIFRSQKKINGTGSNSAHWGGLLHIGPR